MPSVAACEAAGAMSAAAHAASKVVLIRIHAPGEELGSRRHRLRSPPAGPDGRLPNGGSATTPDPGVHIPPASAQGGNAPAVLDGHELHSVLRRRLARGGGANLGLGALLIVGDGDLADRQPRVLDVLEAALHRDLARQADLRELAYELRGEHAVAQRLVVLGGRGAAELVERLAHLLLGT